MRPIFKYVKSHYVEEGINLISFLLKGMLEYVGQNFRITEIALNWKWNLQSKGAVLGRLDLLLAYKRFVHIKFVDFGYFAKWIRHPVECVSFKIVSLEGYGVVPDRLPLTGTVVEYLFMPVDHFLWNVSTIANPQYLIPELAKRYPEKIITHKWSD